MIAVPNLSRTLILYVVFFSYEKKKLIREPLIAVLWCIKLVLEGYVLRAIEEREKIESVHVIDFVRFP